MATVHVKIDGDTEKYIRSIAKSERRTIKALTEILIDEAIEHRKVSKKENHNKREAVA